MADGGGRGFAPATVAAAVHMSNFWHMSKKRKHARGETPNKHSGRGKERERERQTYKSTERKLLDSRGRGNRKTGRRVVKSAVLQVVSSSWLSVGKRRAALSQTVASLPTALPLQPFSLLSLSLLVSKKKQMDKQTLSVLPFFPHPLP